MSKQRSTKKILALAAVALVVLFPVRSFILSSSGLQNQVEQVQSETADIDANIQLASSFENSQAQQDQLAALQIALPGQISIPSILSGVESIAGASGVQWTAGSPSQVVRTPSATSAAEAAEQEASLLTTWTLSMTIVGEIPNIAAFLEQVRTLQRLIAVDSIAITINSDGQLPKATLSTRVFTYSEVS